MGKNRGVTWIGVVLAVMSLAFVVSTGKGLAQGMPGTHTIFMTGMEVKGSTTADKLAPPAVNPTELSKGYGYKAPGKADRQNPQKWQVASYIFTPSFVVLRQGDLVELTVFLVNGDEHEVRISAPDGREVVAKQVWNRGREYEVSFVADQVGSYHLACSTHAPTMNATFLVLPRQ